MEQSGWFYQIEKISLEDHNPRLTRTDRPILISKGICSTEREKTEEGKCCRKGKEMPFTVQRRNLKNTPVIEKRESKGEYDVDRWGGKLTREKVELKSHRRKGRESKTFTELYSEKGGMRSGHPRH